ncbi:MAG: sigma-70 family RNA polymerase sigma factor [Clostridia bacterium]|nr:sigma-70 family RNA polymerase sigma factor [Clostridia bacterium]
MQNANEMRDRLINEFAENYMEKLFYFCLKKTGSNIEAEDLTQDIALQIITALNKGTIPTSFSAWIWQIARNRYSVWAKKKHKCNESVTGSDIGDYEIEDESENILDEMVHTEQLALLRRELAFIKSDYRNIVVAYYIENKNVREIAESLSLPTNTVKSRLLRARQILKEGMDMAREFGIRSYKPEEVDYSNNCSRPGDKNQPYSVMKHKMYQNIMLEAYGNPSTAEELSLELGVALPYMEDELEWMTKETFLIKDGNKYQTAFPIVSRSAQEQVHFAWLTAAPSITKALISFVERLNDAFAEQGEAFYGQYQDYESAKWSILMLAFDYFMYKAPKIREFTKRPDNGYWDIIGYQKRPVSEPNFVGNHCGYYGFQQFKYEFDGISDRTPPYLTEEESKVLYEFVMENTVEENGKIVKKLLEYGYLKENENAYIPDVVTIKTDDVRKAIRNMDERVISELSALAERAKAMLKNLYDEVYGIVCADLPPVFLNDVYQCRMAVSNCYFCRGYVMSEALKSGYLLAYDQVSPAIGAHFWLDS